MIKITDEQRKNLEPLITNIEQLINSEDDEELLLAVDELIIDEYDNLQENLSPKGIILQKIYDDILEANQTL